MYVDGSRVAQWLSEHRAKVLEQHLSAEFEAYLNRYPWAGSHIDWRKLRSDTIVLPEVIDAEFICRCRQTSWGKHGHIMVMYNGREPSVLCSLEDAMADLDLLYSAAPGTRFICGADVVDDDVRIAHSDFAEYDGLSMMRFPCHDDDDG